MQADRLMTERQKQAWSEVRGSEYPQIVQVSAIGVTKHTCIKKVPRQSAELKNDQYFELSESDQLKVLTYSCSGDNAGHIKALIDPDSHSELNAAGFKEVYIWPGDIISPCTRLKTTANTVFKTEPKQSVELGVDQKASVGKGSEFSVKDYNEDDTGHLKVEFWKPPIDGSDRTEYYVFSQHVAMGGYDPSNKPREGNEKTVKGISLRLPGINALVYTNTPIDYQKAPNFTWGEATKNGKRIPENEGITRNIILVAREMQLIRAKFGNRPIKTTSWFRDPSTNRRVGGASRSRHLNGDAVDFYIDGLSVGEVYGALEPGHTGGLAYSPGAGFVHYDLGPCRRWTYSY